MEKIAVFARQKKYSRHMALELSVYFKKYAEFVYYDINDIENMQVVKEKYVILSSFNIFQKVKEKTDESTKIIIINLTLTKDAVRMLEEINPKGRALLVNIDYKNCMEMITLIDKAGFKKMNLVPYYPGCVLNQDFDVAITPDEMSLVPPNIKNIINIGERHIDKDSVLEIANILGVNNPFESKSAKKYRDEIVSLNDGFNQMFNRTSTLREQLQATLEFVPQGLILVDAVGKIYMMNKKAENMLKGEYGTVKGFNIAEIIPATLNNTQDEVGTLISINGKNVIMSVSAIMNQGEEKGHIVLLEYFSEAEDRQHKFRKQISGRTHRAVYTFENIIGQSDEIRRVKKIAKRMAKSELNVCINGESGTGKELFAQSIHNYSDRRKYNFVAVNCSALPENLLESELYGYEEGAFTGAKKGGKIGLFELAHKGTLFLDEIGETSLAAQAKLLRAIEEKKIMRIGGNEMIDVDVRIICATNRELLQMVKDGDFRRDLYYRLSVLPIRIPPLRERKEDIFLLMKNFAGVQGDIYELSEDAKREIRNHSWPGNARELRNVTDYLGYLGKKIIEVDDLPFVFETKDVKVEKNILHEIESESGTGKAGRELQMFMFIFDEICKYQSLGMCIGRQALFNDSQKNELDFSENEIRKSLERLNKLGYVTSYKGRRGSEITAEGYTFYKRQMEDNR